MLVKNTGRVQKKKVPLSRRITPDTGREAIKLSTRGSVLISVADGHKKKPTAKIGWQHLVACIKCNALQIYV